MTIPDISPGCSRYISGNWEEKRDVIVEFPGIVGKVLNSQFFND